HSRWGTRRIDAGGRQEICNLTRVVDVAESLDHISNLAIDLRIEDPEAAANHRLVIVERITSTGDARRKVVFVGFQRPILRIQLVAQAIVQREIFPDLVGMLPEEGGKISWVVVMLLL